MKTQLEKNFKWNNPENRDESDEARSNTIEHRIVWGVQTYGRKVWPGLAITSFIIYGQLKNERKIGYLPIYLVKK